MGVVSADSHGAPVPLRHSFRRSAHLTHYLQKKNLKKKKGKKGEEDAGPAAQFAAGLGAMKNLADKAQGKEPEPEPVPKLDKKGKPMKDKKGNRKSRLMAYLCTHPVHSKR